MARQTENRNKRRNGPFCVPRHAGCTSSAPLNCEKAGAFFSTYFLATRFAVEYKRRARNIFPVAENRGMEATRMASPHVPPPPSGDGQPSESRARPSEPAAHLSLWDAVSIIVGIVIGAGIYE